MIILKVRSLVLIQCTPLLLPTRCVNCLRAFSTCIDHLMLGPFLCARLYSPLQRGYESTMLVNPGKRTCLILDRSTEHQAAIHTTERHARVTAKQQELAYLHHLLDQVCVYEPPLFCFQSFEMLVG